MMQRKAAIIATGSVIIVVILLIVLLTGSSDSSDVGSSSNGADGSDGTKTKPISDNDILNPSSGDGDSNDGIDKDAMPTSDPDTSPVAFSMLAIGDWGTTINKKGGSCCDNKATAADKATQKYKTDFHSQLNIATLMAQSAAELSPKAILSHGDAIYWNGLGSEDATSRMKQTFDDVYNQPSLKGIPWFNVAGNHDIGGSQFMCGPADNQFRPCKSAKELVDAMEAKFTLMGNYKSSDTDRWQMPSHYYKRVIESGGVSVDIYNIDTNWADSHGASQVCCQCYGYSRGNDGGCNQIVPGDPHCAGGDISMYTACMERIEQWWDDSLTNLKKDLAASTSDWRIINTHYSPGFHMGEPKARAIFQICSEFHVHVYMNGHTHGFNHDISKFKTHFFENGGGGGIVSETSGQRPPVYQNFLDTQWIASNDPYGFFEMNFSKDWIKMQFVTFDGAWNFDLNINAVTEGGINRNSGCWHVPRIGTPGIECSSSTGIGNLNRM